MSGQDVTHLLILKNYSFKIKKLFGYQYPKRSIQKHLNPSVILLPVEVPLFDGVMLNKKYQKIKKDSKRTMKQAHSGTTRP